MLHKWAYPEIEYASARTVNIIYLCMMMMWYSVTDNLINTCTPTTNQVGGDGGDRRACSAAVVVSSLKFL